jgi:phosphate:Na+ symporter
VGIGLGLILLALELIVQAVHPITQANGVQVIFASLTGDIMLDALIGAMFAIISYSSLAAVLLTATLTSTGVISFPVALCLVIGANLGSGILAMINNSAANASARRVALGSLLFKLVGSLIILPFVHVLAEAMHRMPLPEAELVIYFHVFYNLIRCVAMVPFAEPMARLCKRMIREDPEQDLHLKPKHLDTTALDTPALALANAARETLRIGDAMEQMLGAAQGDARRAAGGEGAAQVGGRYQRALHRDQALSGPHAERRAGRRGVPSLGGDHRNGAQSGAGFRYRRKNGQRNRR